MKKLTEQEFSEKIVTGRGRSSAFYKAIIGLKKGENLLISKEEYTLKHGVGRICKLICNRFPQVKFSHGKLADGTGWVVKRVE